MAEAPTRLSFGIVAATVWFWLVFAATAPIAVLVGAVVFLATAPFDRNRNAIHGFICGWTFAYLRAWPLWRVWVRGRERLPRGPAVFVANHQSMADVVAAMGLRTPFKFVSKSSLFGLPLVGWLMRMAQYVSIERGKTGSTRQMMEDCRRWLRRGVPVLIFPEGTYSGGDALLPFKRGAFTLAIEEQVPLVPIVLRGTATLIRGDGPWMNARAEVGVEVLPAIGPAELGGDAQALSDEVRRRLERALGEGAVPGRS